MRIPGWALVFLVPQAAHASFNSAGACQSFGCYVVFFGVLVGVYGGIPASAIAFALLHMFFRNPGRTRAAQLVTGMFAGIAVFLVAAAGASYMASINGSAAMGFAIPFAAAAVLSVLHARSKPRQRA